MSSDPSPEVLATRGLGIGCLAGFGLAITFIAISGLAYMVLGFLGLSQNIRLFFAVLSGPVIGTVLALLIWIAYSNRLRERSGE
jgi:hypothetical protein